LQCVQNIGAPFSDIGINYCPVNYCSLTAYSGYENCRCCHDTHIDQHPIDIGNTTQRTHMFGIVVCIRRCSRFDRMFTEALSNLHSAERHTDIPFQLP